MMKIKEAARVVLVDVLALKDHETLGLVVDDTTKDLGQAFYELGQTLAGETFLLRMAERDNHGQEPPYPVAAAMAECDLLLLLTRYSLSHTQARKRACDRGARVASMPGLSEDMLLRSLKKEDMEEIHRLGKAYKSVLDEGSQVRLISPAGTDLSFSIQGRSAFNDDGRLSLAGAFGNLPAGEAYLAPLEGTAQGKLVVDGSMAGLGLMQAPLQLTVQDGLVVGVAAGPQQKDLLRIFDTYGRASRNIAELGLGTNPSAQLTGQILEDEKIWGTVHVALGDNATFGGQVVADSHLDAILLKPSLYVDDQLIIEEGRPLL